MQVIQERKRGTKVKVEGDARGSPAAFAAAAATPGLEDVAIELQDDDAQDQEAPALTHNYLIDLELGAPVRTLTDNEE